MTSQLVLITDTNIWIDLDNGGILVDVFRLPYHFLVPDIATGELIRPRWETLQALGLVLQELTSDQVVELVDLIRSHRNLSAIDLASFLLSKSLHANLLTGDSRLYALAASNDIPVHGVLWLLDEMVRLRILAHEQAAEALQRMIKMGARLPREESRKRIINWSR